MYQVKVTVNKNSLYNNISLVDQPELKIEELWIVFCEESSLRMLQNKVWNR